MESKEVKRIIEEVRSLGEIYIRAKTNLETYKQKSENLEEKLNAVENQLRYNSLVYIANMGISRKIINNQTKAINGLKKSLKKRTEIITELNNLIKGENKENAGIIIETLMRRPGEIDLLVQYNQKANQIISLSPRYLKDLGYEREEVVGHNLTELIQKTIGNIGEYFGNPGNEREIKLLGKKEKGRRKIREVTARTLYVHEEYQRKYGEDKLSYGIVAVHFEKPGVIKEIWKSLCRSKNE